MANPPSAPLPVVVVHLGAQAHVLACLRETARRNEPLYLIGDVANRHFARECPGLRWIDVRELGSSSVAESFRTHFVNYSTNPHSFELNCFVRMFRLRALLDLLGAEACFYLDSDCALLTDVRQVAFERPDALVVHADFGNPLRMTASVHNARLSRDFLDRFARICHEVYVERSRFDEVTAKLRRHVERRLPGGLCDMTIYHLVTRELAVQDLGHPRDGEVFDHRFGSAEGDELEEQYVLAGEHKLLHREGDAFYVQDVRGPRVRLLSVHFQGIAKRFVGLLNGGSATRE